MMGRDVSVRRIVVVGDAYVSPTVLAEAARTLPFQDAEIVSLMWGSGDKEEFTEMQTEIEKKGPDAAPYPDELDDVIGTADILLIHFCPIPAGLIKRAANLKLVGICRGGFENVDAEALTERKVPLIHIIRNAEAVAEFTLGLMLAETRNIARSHQKIVNGEWTTDFCNTEFTATLKNMTAGLIGLGNIGALLSEKLSALGVRVIGYDEYLPADVMEKLPVEKAESMEEVFEKADIISLHLRLTKSNQGLVGRELLSRMRPTAYLINASRAGLIDEPALIEALEEHRIAGAALDVFEQEPLQKDHPLMKLDNVTLTPHIAGDTVDSIARSPFPLADVVRDYFETGNRKNVCN